MQRSQGSSCVDERYTITATITDIIEVMEDIAPSNLAEEWDNVGLQVGSRKWPVRNVLVALDPSLEAVTEARDSEADLLITHHPLIFKPLRSIDPDSPAGKILEIALLSRTGILAAHTNFDNVKGGTNDILAERIGLKNLEVLGEVKTREAYKLVLHVPSFSEEAVIKILFGIDPLRMGTSPYNTIRVQDGKELSVRTPMDLHTDGTESVPGIGDVRIETVAEKKDIKTAIGLLRNHSEEIISQYDLYPVEVCEKHQGLGRVGELSEPLDLVELSLQIKKQLGLKNIKIAGAPDLDIKKAAICTGSGSSMLESFFSSGAEVFISGDLRYHDARAVEEAGLGLIDIGHFASEHLAVQDLCGKLKKILSEKGMDIGVEIFNSETDPFWFPAA